MTTPNSTAPQTKRKPAKPRPNFPLFPHATGRWAKRIKGRLCYLGSWGDPHGALERHLDQKDDLYVAAKSRLSAPTGWWMI